MKRPKLPALTSLRFVAAAMILLHHTRYLLSSDTSWAMHWHLDHGVSLFFVLSGFILTYSYPSLETTSKLKQFLIARLARIWPVHVFCLLIMFAFLPIRHLIENSHDLSWVLPFNLLMLHAWFPYKASYFSLNSPSWSISAEFFFYLCFPILIFRWEKTWLTKLICSTFLLTSMILLGNHFQLPAYSDSTQGVTTLGLIYIHPLARLFEFVLGMSATVLWKRMEKIIPPSFWISSAIELSAGIFAVFWLYELPLWNLASRFFGPTGMEWVGHCGSCFVFALFIPTLALGRGIVSKVLSMSLFVTLGEISFSMYLLTHVTERVLASYFPTAFFGISRLSLLLLWALILWYAYFTWKFVEMPSRKWILRSFAQRINPESYSSVT